MQLELARGSIVGDYRLDDLIGRGGMGVVFRATQLKLGRSVALKVISPALAADEESRMRFVREARTGASIEHPNAVPVYEVGDDGGFLYISMRHVAGTDLSLVIEREAHLEPSRAVEIVSQVAAALDASHAQGVVHRDVKPHNVLLTEHDGREHVYLTDFGLARHLLDTGLTVSGQSLGTPAYMSPEQVRGARVDARADVYSLGVTLFHALTGDVPFNADSMLAVLYMHVTEPVPPATSRNNALDPAINAVIARAMAKTPEDRFPSAGDLALAARAALSGTTPDRAERSVATGMAAGADIGVPGSDFPARITDAYIRAEAARMSPARFDEFLAVLRSRGWGEDDLEPRVYPYAPDGWRPPQPVTLPAIVVVYESVNPASRTRELLDVLPGGIENALRPAELGELMRDDRGEPLSKASVRAVMRNLQRLEARLLDEGTISRRVLAKSFAQYDVEQAGRYYLEAIDRAELDTHIAGRRSPSSKKTHPPHSLGLGGDDVPGAAGAGDIHEPVVLIRITRLSSPGMSGDELYEATRKWWKMNPHLHDPEFAFTVVGGTVRAVYRIEGWRRQRVSRRWAFHGRRDLSMEAKYVGQDVTGLLPHGAQNPIRYVNC